MKGVAPFLGVATPERRASLKTAWAQLRNPTSDELGKAALALMRLPEREYHYAAYDLIARFNACADEDFLSKYGTRLLTIEPWWDTVDGLGNAMVTPLCLRFDHRDLIDEWSESGDRWLIRAAIGHQRGRKAQTDIPEVLDLCDRHWDNREFFIAKAIGWALRDLARMEPAAVRAFLRDHDAKNRVAIREAERGLAR
jgi:3-methyladenine DNA glycosylase AlkD